jgi:hypothetical protein
MKMRQITKGDSIEFQNKCPFCNFAYDVQLSIEENLIVEVSEKNEISLLDGQLKIRLQDISIDEEVKFAETQKADNLDQKLEFIYNFLYESIKEVFYNGEVFSNFTKKEITDFLDELPGSENSNLLMEMNKITSNIKLQKKVNCLNCKKENIIEQESLNFFFS